MPPEPEFDCAGGTTTGVAYPTISSMWQSELPSSSTTTPTDAPHDTPSPPSSPTWYEKSASYWATQSASVNGMLGGLGRLDKRDTAASAAFLSALRDAGYVRLAGTALDVGAGIGRVTRRLLLPLFARVDMLEQNEHYLMESGPFLQDAQGNGNGRVEHRIATGMHLFNADWNGGVLRRRYELIWIQWCIIYLTDDHLVAFLEECLKCLKEGGLICVKDNVAREGFLVDKDDSSVMRSDAYLKHLFARARVRVVRETMQRDFPKNVFPVRTYALAPMLHVHSEPDTTGEPTLQQPASAVPSR